MNVNEVINFLITNKITRSECRDLSFGDTEVYFELSNGTEIGSGYFSRTNQSIWLNINNKEYNFFGDEASNIRKSAPIKTISRNDNEGKW